MSDTFTSRVNWFGQTHQVDGDKTWRNLSVRDIQPRMDWFIHPTHLMDDPLETITIDHAMKGFLATKKSQRAWQDTNCIQGMKVPATNPFQNKVGLK